MLCKKCGNPVGDGLEKCPFCGEPLGKAQPGEDKTDDVKDEKIEGTNPADGNAEKQDEGNGTIGQEQSLSETKETGQETSISEAPKFSPVSVGKPEKPHKKALIIAACAVVLVAAVGIITKTYFARDVMRTFMGNGKYLQKSETSAVNVMLDKSVGGLDNIKMASLRDKNIAYSSEASVNVGLDGTVKNQLGPQFDKIINFINSLSIKGSNYSDGKAVQSDFSVSHKTNKLLYGSYYFTEGGSQIFKLPEISNTTYLVNNAAIKYNSFNLKYDSGKLKASLQKLVKIYTDEIPNGKASVQKNRKLTVKGVSVSAEKVSITLSGKQLNDIYKKIYQTIKNDDYIYTLISENYNIFSYNKNMYETPKAPTKKEFQDKCDSEIKAAESNSSNVPGTFTVSAYIKPDNTQVARSYEYTNSSTGSKSSIDMIFVNENGTNKYAFNAKSDGKNDMSGLVSCNSSGTGAADVSFYDNSNGGSAENKVKVDFSNIKKESFAGGKALTGTIGITFSIPPASNNYRSPFQGLSDLSIKAVAGISGGKENSKISINIKNAANINFKVINTPITQKKITVPKIQKNNAVYLYNEAGANYELQSKYRQDVSKYFMSLPSKDSDLADIITSLFYGGMAPQKGRSTMVS